MATSNPSDMTSGDFQRLLQIALSDLAIRRTLMENHMADLSAQPRSMERDAEIERSDMQVQRIAADYRHYQQFVDPTLAKKIDIDYEN